MGCGLWGIDEVYNLGEEQLNKSFLYNLVTLNLEKMYTIEDRFSRYLAGLMEGNQVKNTVPEAVKASQTLN